MVKSRMIRWAGHVARRGTRGIRIVFWWESRKERDHYEDLDAGGRIILKLIIDKWNEVVWTGFIWLMIRPSEHDNKPSGSIKIWKFIE
jgi:hypothetical protein